MRDAVAFLIFYYFLMMCGVGPGCTTHGPGVPYTIDDQQHYIKIGVKGAR